jgi:hypothetical protein
MARRRRPGPRTAVVDGRAQLIIPIEVILDADGEPMRFGDLKRWFRPVATFSDAVAPALEGVSMLLDRFAYDLHLSDIGHSTDVHDGDVFVDAARSHDGIDVFLVEAVDPRRSKPEELSAAAVQKRLLGGTVPFFEVDMLEA